MRRVLMYHWVISNHALSVSKTPMGIFSGRTKRRGACLRKGSRALERTVSFAGKRWRMSHKFWQKAAMIECWMASPGPFGLFVLRRSCGCQGLEVPSGRFHFPRETTFVSLVLQFIRAMNGSSLVQKRKDFESTMPETRCK